MNRTWKLFNYLVSTILSLAAVLTIFCTWSPLLLPIFNSTNSIPQNDGFEVPMRVVGVNYPNISFLWLGASLAIAILVLFLFAKRRKASSAFFWINGIAISIILGHIIVWNFWMHPNW